MELKEAQKSSPQAPESLENDLIIQHDVDEALHFAMKHFDLSSSEGQLGAQICFQEVRKLRERELAGAKSKLRAKKSSKKRR